MVIPEPRFHVLAETRGEGDEFAGFIRADAADRIVFGGVAFAAAGVEIIGIVLTSGSENEGQSLQGPVVREVSKADIIVPLGAGDADFAGKNSGDR